MQAVFNALLQIFLCALNISDRAAELLVLTSHGSDLVAQSLDLVGQIKYAAAQLGIVFRGTPHVFGRSLLGSIDFLTKIKYGASGLVVIKQGSLRAEGEQTNGSRQGDFERFHNDSGLTVSEFSAAIFRHRCVI